MRELVIISSGGDYKQVNVMTTLASTKLSSTVRKMLRKLGTNNLWSQFSMEGRKGKLPFQDLPVCRVVVRKYIQHVVCHTLFKLL
jgi:hypothetical protein